MNVAIAATMYAVAGALVAVKAIRDIKRFRADVEAPRAPIWMWIVGSLMVGLLWPVVIVALALDGIAWLLDRFRRVEPPRDP